MKKLLLVGVGMLVAAGAFGQGLINYNTRIAGSVIAPVFGNEVGNPGLLKTGNRTNDFAPGTQTYTGALLSSNTTPTMRAVLYAGPLGTPDASLQPVPGSVIEFRGAPFAGFILAPTALAIPGVAAGNSARLQLRAFDTASGATYETSLNRGASLSFDSATLVSGTTPPNNLVGLTAFNVAVVPEPSTIALGALGAIFFLIRRRK